MVEGRRFQAIAPSNAKDRPAQAMQRRDFIALVGTGLVSGALGAGGLAVQAQQTASARRIGILVGLSADDAEGAVRFSAFEQGLAARGWIIGGDVVLDYR